MVDVVCWYLYHNHIAHSAKHVAMSVVQPLPITKDDHVTLFIIVLLSCERDAGVI